MIINTLVSFKFYDSEAETRYIKHHDFGRRYFKRIENVQSVKDCKIKCKEESKCNRFTWSRTYSRCFLYKEKYLDTRKVKKRYKVVSSILENAEDYSGKKGPSSTGYSGKKLFVPQCGAVASDLMIERGSAGPKPIGGWCLRNKTHSKECGEDCIDKSETCNGVCSHDQCLTKAVSKDFKDIFRF